MLRRVLVCLTFALTLWIMPLMAGAQSLPGLPLGSGSTEETQSSELADAIRTAAESGVSVVVLDSAGNLVSAVNPTTDDEEAPAEMDGASPLMKAQSEVKAFRQRLQERLDALPRSLEEVSFILRATSPDGRIMTYVEVLLWSLVLFAIGSVFATQIYGKRVAKRFVVARIKENPQGYAEKMPFLVFRFFMGIIGTLVGMTVAYILGALFFGPVDDSSIELTIAAIYSAFFISRTVSDLWRMVLSPYLSQYRIPVLSDRDAKRLYHWSRIVATIDIWALMFSTWIGDFGLNYNVYALIYGALSLFVAFINILMVLFNGRAISNAIRGGRTPAEVPWITRFVSYAWAPLLIGYVIFGWFELSFDLVLERPTSIPLLAGAYGVFLSIIVVFGAINYLIERYFNRTRALSMINQDMALAEAQEELDGRDVEDEPVAPPAPRHPLSTFEQLARRVAGILAFVAGGYALMLVWDTDGTLLALPAVDRLLDIIVIVFIGYIVYHFFRIWIDSKIAEETSDEVEGELGDEGGATSASRLATLLPLFRNFILVVVVVTITLIVLLELGINVSPLFAGAGVVGLAVGFGAQTLVRDIFSGAFFLLDDAFRKGEYIDIGSVKGTVERISVRSFQLRHHLGALNTIPFGEIQVLTNYSRDWVIMKLPLRVTYDTDVERVRKLIKKLGQELLSDPVIGENFIQPLKSQGVIEMQDSAMIIRVKFMTKPGDQWLVRKKVYEEIRELFAREGIRFAHRQVTVRLADEDAEKLSPQQREAVMGAAQSVIDEEAIEGVNEAGGDDR